MLVTDLSSGDVLALLLNRSDVLCRDIVLDTDRSSCCADCEFCDVYLACLGGTTWCMLDSNEVQLLSMPNNLVKINGAYGLRLISQTVKRV